MKAGNAQNDLYESTIPALSTVVGLLGGLVASFAVYKAIRWIMKRKACQVVICLFLCLLIHDFKILILLFLFYLGWRLSKVVNMTDTAAGSMESAGWKSYNLGEEVRDEEV